MRWYVVRNGETVGPVDGETLFQWGRDGMLLPGMHIRDEQGGNWMPVEQSPFAAAVKGGAEKPLPGSETLGYLIALTPLLVAGLIWQWVGGMTLLERPDRTLTALTLLTIAGTTVLITVEASNLGMGQRPDVNGKPGSSPLNWFLSCAFIWVVGFPLYLHRRSNFGRKSLALPGILSMAAFLWAAVAMQGNIEQASRAQLYDQLRAPGVE